MDELEYYLAYLLYKAGSQDDFYERSDAVHHARHSEAKTLISIMLEFTMPEIIKWLSPYLYYHATPEEIEQAEDHQEFTKLCIGRIYDTKETTEWTIMEEDSGDYLADAPWFTKEGYRD